MATVRLALLIGLIAVAPACHAADYPAACRGFAEFLRGDLQQPIRPACVDGIYSKVDIEFCQPLMDLYQRQVQQYVECLKAENESIIATFNAAAARFNCAQRGIAY
jgi:hypothetical protein